MMLTELARRVEISIAYLSRMPLDDLFAAARRLPPDLLSRIDHDRSLPAPSRREAPMTLQVAYPFDRRSLEPAEGIYTRRVIRLARVGWLAPILPQHLSC